MKITTVIGARPQFIKAAALTKAFRQQGIHERVLHTGQHYDKNMSDIFFKDLEMPEPTVNLGVTSSSHAEQTATMLVGIEKDLLEFEPDAMLVYGDTNSTLAGALAAAKLHIPVIHVEAGLRSFDKKMPEEINRVLTDNMSNLLLCPTQTAVDNLVNENVSGKIELVGDVMQVVLMDLINVAKVESTIHSKLGHEKDSYYLATIHRAENTNNEDKLFSIMTTLGTLGVDVILPMHPRTKNVLQSWGWKNTSNTLHVVDPVGYLDMISLIDGARMVLTDSGGLQKEAGWLGKQCVTLRENTEWVETVEMGLNKLVGTDDTAIKQAIAEYEKITTNLNLAKNIDVTEKVINAIKTNLV